MEEEKHAIQFTAEQWKLMIYCLAVVMANKVTFKEIKEYERDIVYIMQFIGNSIDENGFMKLNKILNLQLELNDCMEKIK